ncbi:hypothetical protein CI102_13366 [Trichoderma harzianum]|nr:hypothetical protein CI102_13366 [Trichoderma harzianum]
MLVRWLQTGKTTGATATHPLLHTTTYGEPYDGYKLSVMIQSRTYIHYRFGWGVSVVKLLGCICPLALTSFIRAVFYKESTVICTHAVGTEDLFFPLHKNDVSQL